jgi:purine-nucleoside/S-methyl-5'-thioadenosine phosphorylase / adenosine deaminase
MVTPDKMKLCVSGLAALPGVRHGFFTRQGGVSGGIYASLNCGPGSRDDAANVVENRARVAELLGAKPGRLITVFQKHSADAVIAEAPWKGDTPPEADAIVTKTPGLAIGVLTADCAPVLFCDGDARVIGAAHAGWKGALGGILEATVEAMRKLGAKPERITAAIGPAISQDAYEVGAEFVERFVAEEPGSAAFFITDQASGEPHFDLPAYVGERLARAGVGSIAELGLCTYCEESRLFSYRRSQHHGEDDYGRQISAIVLA